MICFQFQQISKNKTTHTATTIGLRGIDDTTMVKEGVSPDMAKHMEREKEKVMNILEKERGKGKGKGSRIITVLVWEAVISPNPRDMVKVDKARVRGSMAVVKERESEH